jgi:hypothetical protein
MYGLKRRRVIRAFPISHVLFRPFSSKEKGQMAKHPALRDAALSETKTSTTDYTDCGLQPLGARRAEENSGPTIIDVVLGPPRSTTPLLKS